MKQLKVYKWEIISRWPLWYVMVFSIIIFLVLYSFFQGSLMGGLSVLFIFLVIIVWYIISYLISLKKTTIKIEDNFLLIWDKPISFDKIIGFNVELDNKGKFKNFVLSTIDSELPLKYTIDDTSENVKQFVSNLLDKGLSLYDWYENNRFYKIIKFLKL